MKNNELSDVLVDEHGIDLPTMTKGNSALQSLSKKFNSVNSALSDLAQLEADCQTELKDVKNEIAELTGQLKVKQKELRQTIKVISEKRLLHLGERGGYLKQIAEMGGKVKRLDVSKLIGSGTKGSKNNG
jgi:chromosome segregation ATPase